MGDPFAAKLKSRSQSLNNRARAKQQLTCPTDQTVLDLALADALLLVGEPPKGANQREWVRSEALKHVQRAYGVTTEKNLPGLVPSARVVLGRWRPLHTQKGRAAHERDSQRARDALVQAGAVALGGSAAGSGSSGGSSGGGSSSGSIAAHAAAGKENAAPVVVPWPASVPKRKELMIRSGEAFLGWVARFAKRLPSKHVFDSGRSEKAGKNELKRQKQGDGVVKPVLTGTGNGTRTSEHASSGVGIKMTANLSDAKTTATVSAKTLLVGSNSAMHALTGCCCLRRR